MYFYINEKAASNINDRLSAHFANITNSLEKVASHLTLEQPGFISRKAMPSRIRYDSRPRQAGARFSCQSRAALLSTA